MTAHLSVPAEVVREYGEELMRPDLVAVDGYHPDAILGFLQTRSYARATMGLLALNSGWSEAQLDEAVDLRDARQEYLAEATGIAKTFTITQAGLRHQIGSPLVMAEATRHVGELFMKPPKNTTFQLIPEAAVPGTENFRGGLLGEFLMTTVQNPETGEQTTTAWAVDGEHRLSPDDKAAGLLISDRSTLANGLHVSGNSGVELVRLTVPPEQAIAIITIEAQRWEQQAANLA